MANTKIVLNRQSDLILDNAQITNPSGIKTSNIYKSIDYDLPPELHTQLSLSLKQMPRKYLFVSDTGKPFNRDSFSKWASMKLTRVFKKEFTLTMFRHIYISALDLNSTPETLYDISRKMGHSITQQMLYKWKEQNEVIEEDV